MVDKQLSAFVVGPIGEPKSTTRRRADLLFNEILKPAVELLSGACDINIWRADHDVSPGMIPAKIVRGIVDCSVVVADLSELRPNVLYELGIAHTIGKPTVIVRDSASDLPFDLYGHTAIAVNYARPNRKALIAEVKSQIGAAISARSVSNPVLDVSLSSGRSLTPRYILENIEADERERILVQYRRAIGRNIYSVRGDSKASWRITLNMGLDTMEEAAMVPILEAMVLDQREKLKIIYDRFDYSAK